MWILLRIVKKFYHYCHCVTARNEFLGFVRTVASTLGDHVCSLTIYSWSVKEWYIVFSFFWMFMWEKAAGTRNITSHPQTESFSERCWTLVRCGVVSTRAAPVVCTFLLRKQSQSVLVWFDLLITTLTPIYADLILEKHITFIFIIYYLHPWSMCAGIL